MDHGLEKCTSTEATCLGVFAGGFTLEAVETVCSGDGEPPVDMLAVIAALVDQHLLERGEVMAHAPRFRMLETVHEFAVEELRAHGELEALQRRHADYVLALTERAGLRILTPFEQARAQVVQAEQANIRSALAWAVAHGATEADAAELGLRVVVALFVWFYHEAIREGQQWATTIVSLPGASARTALRAEALRHAGFFTLTLGPGARSTRRAPSAGGERRHLSRARR